MPHTRRPDFQGDGIVEPMKKNTEGPAWFASYTKIRSDSYVMLASLLGQPPSENLLKVLQNLQWEKPIPEKVDRALKALREASHDYPHGTLKEEYHKLF